jgi:Plasmid stabilization system protein
MNKICISPEAARDLEEIKRYISKELKNPDAAKRTVQTITKELRTLSRFPEAGPSIEALTGYSTDLRYFVCGKRIALYRYDKDAVYVARILDPRQDYLRVLFGDDFWERNDSAEKDVQERIHNAESLMGILPGDMTIEQARDERLKNI